MRGRMVSVGLALVVLGIGSMVVSADLLTYSGQEAATPLPSGPYDSLTVGQKKLYLGTDQQRQIAASAQNGIPVQDPPIAALPRQAAWPSGIQESFSPAPIGPPDFTATNVWAGVVDQVRVLVYAGGTGKPGSAGQGELLVWRFDTEAGHLVRYLTPTAQGFVRIVSATGTRLTVQTDSGVTYVFDVSTVSYIGS